MSARRITVAGAGVLGLWQALTLARRGHDVHLLEASAEPFATAASRLGGVMLAPDCESEAAPHEVRDWGREGLDLWRAAYPHVISKGSLIVALPRDQAELTRFAKLTEREPDAGAARLGSEQPAIRFFGGAHVAGLVKLPGTHKFIVLGCHVLGRQ